MVSRSPSDGADGEQGRPAPEFILAGRALLGGRLQPIEVGIGPDGEIVEIGRSLRGGDRHDVGEAVILPSATDLHVHFRDPGGPKEVESFETGTLQAAFGGVGLVGDMPNTRPPVTDLERWQTKVARTRGHLAVGAFLYGAATTPLEVRRLAPHVGAFKLYLSPTTGIGPPPLSQGLPALLETIASTGLGVSVHAELPERFTVDPTRTPSDPVDWDRARPPKSELDAVERVLAIGPARLRLHLAHLTVPTSAGFVRSAGVSAEATPHHLLLAARPGRSSRDKVNPPLRSEADRLGLWQAFRAGEVAMVASDHAPHPLGEKEKPFYLAPSGMPGVETMLPLLLEQVRAGELELATLLAAACDRPARWVGVPHGRLAPGHQANLIVVDFRQRRRIEARRLHAPCGWTAFEGWEGIFPTEHYRDGKRIVEAGEFVGDLRAALVRPEYAPDRAAVPSG